MASIYQDEQDLYHHRQFMQLKVNHPRRCLHAWVGHKQSAIDHGMSPLIWSVYRRLYNFVVSPPPDVVAKLSDLGYIIDLNIGDLYTCNPEVYEASEILDAIDPPEPHFT